MLIENKKQSKAPIKRHAFGRMLSPKSRRIQSLEVSAQEPFEFPENIRSGKYLFKGIDHLRCILYRYQSEWHFLKYIQFFVFF